MIVTSREVTSKEVAEHQRLIIGVTTVALILAVTSYVLRLYARWISVARLWYDDYFMCAGLVSRTTTIALLVG